MADSAENKYSVLVIDDECSVLERMRTILLNAGVKTVATLNDSRVVFDFLERNEVSVIVLDLIMPYLSGKELLPLIHTNYPHIQVIIVTGSNDTETVVDCMRNGAYDFVVKPVDIKRLVSSINRALNMGCLCKEFRELKETLISNRLQNADVFSDIKTNSRQMRAIFQYVEIIAKSSQPILITGETGVGKDLLARSIHKLSGVKGELVTVNVAGLDDSMFSDTLFGHKKGAFTGADQIREGLICKASGGTLLLDEIGDLSGLSQVKLLRLIQENEFYPVGSDTIKRCSARLILATNHDLDSLVEEGHFRKDLYYRLCCHNVNIPPLRERKEDIVMLLMHFIESAALEFEKRPPTVSPELIAALLEFKFPGNIRELRAKVFDAVARNRGGMLSLNDFPCLSPALPSFTPRLNSDESQEGSIIYSLFGRLPTFREIENYLIDEAMKLSNGNPASAAKILGVTRQTINNRMKSKK